MNNKTAKCHDCGSRFTVISCARKNLGYKVIYLCRTCTYGGVLRMDRILNGKQRLIIPFVKRRIWSLGNKLV